MKKVLVLLLCLLVLAGCTNNKVDEPQTLEEPPVKHVEKNIQGIRPTKTYK